MTLIPASLTQIDLLQTAGVAGFLVYIFAFAGVQFGRLSGNSNCYSILNILAASLVGLSLISQFNLASALIQGSWIAIGLAGIGLRLWSRPKSRISRSTRIGTNP